MTKETKTIAVTAYRDSKGNPCCAGDFRAGEVCQFYRTQRFGCHETCVFAEDRGRHMEGLHRRDGGFGSLIPIKACPVWADAGENARRKFHEMLDSAMDATKEGDSFLPKFTAGVLCDAGHTRLNGEAIHE